MLRIEEVKIKGKYQELPLGAEISSVAGHPPSNWEVKGKKTPKYYCVNTKWQLLIQILVPLLLICLERNSGGSFFFPTAFHENKCVYFSITEPIYCEKIQSSKVNCFSGIYNEAHRHHFLSSWGRNCKLDFNKPDAGNINLDKKP